MEIWWTIRELTYGLTWLEYAESWKSQNKESNDFNIQNVHNRNSRSTEEADGYSIVLSHRLNSSPLLTLVVAVEDVGQAVGAFEVEEGGDRQDQKQTDEQSP